jgi:hypothetical protein
MGGTVMDSATRKSIVRGLVGFDYYRTHFVWICSYGHEDFAFPDVCGPTAICDECGVEWEWSEVAIVANDLPCGAVQLDLF